MKEMGDQLYFINNTLVFEAFGGRMLRIFGEGLKQDRQERQLI